MSQPKDSARIEGECQSQEVMTKEKGVRESNRYFYFTNGTKQRKTHCSKCHGINGLDGLCRNCGKVVA